MSESPTETLLAAVLPRFEAETGDAEASIATETGLVAIRARRPSGLDYQVQRPLVCLVLQGTKLVLMGERAYRFTAGDTLIITADVPTASQVLEADPTRPYVSVVADLDPAIIAELSLEMAGIVENARGPVRHDETGREVSEAVLRLLKLADRPAAVPLLRAAQLRELHYWLLAGRHGAAIRALGSPDGQARRVARAVALLKSEYARSLPVERLAAEAGMSTSAFHHHFRAVTALSPRQFQKQLRLIEARRLMLADGMTASNAAFAVGYESVPQFNREYRRMYGLPPAQDAQQARGRLVAPAA